MVTLAQTSLTPVERRVLETFVERLREELGEELSSVWLYGSRARGEQPRQDSDVDVLVVARRRDFRDEDRVARVLDEAAIGEGTSPVPFSLHVYDPVRLAQRREIRSFFIQEVDRDKVVLYGER